MQRFAIGLAALALVVSFHVDAGAHNVPYTSPKMLAVAGATTSIPQISGGSVCSASVSGRWAGTLAFQVSSPGALPESAEAQSDHGNNVGRTTSRDGIFVWRASEGQTCHVTMTSDRGGIAAVALAASNGVASSGETPLDPPSYVTWYNTTSPWPSPITSAYVGIGGALGAGNIYNTATNGFATPGTGSLGTGECAFLCFGAPGTASANVVLFGNDVKAHSFSALGAPDDCSGSTAPLCPGGIGDSVFAVEYYESSSATQSVFLAIDKNAHFAVLNGFYAGGAIVAGAGLGTPAPVPSPTTGSLVSYTGTPASPNTGDVLLGSSASYVKCDYGETTGGVLTCNQPFVASSGLTGDCGTTLSTTSCRFLTGGGPQSLFLGQSSSNYNEGGFLFDGASDIDIGAGAYASFSGGVGSCCTATQTQASLVQLTNNGNGINFFYNSGLTIGNTFTPTAVAGINASSTIWAAGGVQPNSTTAGGSGGYAPEAFPLGAAEQHPQILSGSCGVTAPLTLCTFPNSFEFSDTGYNCTISAQGASALSASYVKTSAMAITIYSGSGATFSYTCMR